MNSSVFRDSGKSRLLWKPALYRKAEVCGIPFVMIGSGEAFLSLLAATVPHLLAAFGDWFSTPDLARIYREIEPIDFSKAVLSASPERLLVLRDEHSGWTDLGSPQRVKNVIYVVSAF